MSTKKKKQHSHSQTKTQNLLRSPKLNIGIVVVLAGALILVGIFYVLLSQAAAPAVPRGYREVFKDDFDGAALNTAVWKPYFSTYGDGNQEEACLTPNNAVVSNGTLKIISKREAITCPGKPTDQFSSAFLGTRENGVYFPKFARYEMRARLPHGQGLWPAFWLRHKNGSSIAEVDVMEYFHAQVPGRTTGTIHLDNVKNVSKKTVAFENPTTSPGWHTWAVEMEPDTNDATKVKFTFSLDGTAYHTVTPTQNTWATAVDPEKMFDIALNTAVGGNYNGHPDDNLGWSRYLNFCLKPYRGNPPCDASNILRAQFPATYEIDYVRVLVKDSSTTTSTVTPTPSIAPTSTPGVGQILPPVNFAADAGVNSVNLSWSKSSDLRVDEYSVRYIRSDAATKADGSTWVYPGRVTGTSQGITGLIAGVSYDFQVRAVDNLATADSTDDIRSDYSATVVAVPKAESSPSPTPTVTSSPTPTPTNTPNPVSDTAKPTAPSGVRGRIEFDALKFGYFTNLTWTASFDNLGVSRYLIHRNGSQIGVSASTNFKDYNLQPNIPYTYEVFAQDAAGNTSTPGTAKLIGRCFLIWCWSE